MKHTFIFLLTCLSTMIISAQTNELSLRLGQLNAPVFDPGFVTGIQYFKQMNSKWAAGVGIDYRKGHSDFEYYEREMSPVNRELFYSHRHKARIMNYDAMVRYTALQNKAGTFKANISGGVSWQRYAIRHTPSVSFQDFRMTEKMSAQSTKGYVMPKLAMEAQYFISSRFFVAASVCTRFLTGSSELFSEKLTSVTSSATITVRKEYVNGHQLAFEIGAGFRF